MQLKVLPYSLTVAKYDRPPVLPSGFCSLSIVEGEVSLVCETVHLPVGSLFHEDGWRALMVEGPLDFSLVGILSALSGVLAEAKIPIFALSTFDTDYLLVKSERLCDAVAALKEKGYCLI